MGVGPTAPVQLSQDLQPDSVIAKPRGRVPRAYPGHWPGKEEDQNPKVKGPSVEDTGSQLSRGYIGGYSKPNK